LSRTDATPFDEALREYLGRHGLARRIRQAGVVNDWPDLVGTELARVTTPESVDARGTLWVRVSSSAWQQELQLMTPTILRELAARGRRISNIRWIAGTGSPPRWIAPRPSPRQQA